MAVADGASPVGGLFNIAHYAFDDSGDLGLDSSTNQNNIECASVWQEPSGTYGPSGIFTNDAVAGGGAVYFSGFGSITPCNQTFNNWSNTFIGSFSVSAWIKTTTVVGNDTDNLGDTSGQTVIYMNNNSAGEIPLGITVSKAACFTGNENYQPGDTLHSTHSVTTGNYVHVVVTRDQASGQKTIYIKDGRAGCRGLRTTRPAERNAHLCFHRR